MSAWTFDRVSRIVALALGLVATAIGVVTFVGVFSGVNNLLGSFAFVGAVGIVAFLFGLWMVRKRYRGGPRQTSVPTVEVPLATPAPGHEIDEALYRLTQLRQGTTEYKEQIQTRMAEVAVAVIRHHDNCSREAAVQQLQEGTWTDNRAAAAFFTGGSPPSLSFSERLSQRFSGDDTSAYERWVTTTVDAIIKRADMATETAVDVEDTSDDGLLARLGFGSGSATNDAPTSSTNYRGMDVYADAERVADGVLYNDRIETGLWRGVTAFALIAAGWGILTFQPAVLLMSGLGIAFAAYARSASEPPLAHLEVERTLDDSMPKPGEPVEVTVSVENTSGSFMADLRLVDRVPETMRVVNGSPRLATALGAGSKATFTYTVVAERGTHEWPLLAIGRDISGSVEREAIIDVDGEIECVPSLKTTSEMPVRSQTSLYSGQVDTSVGGSGLEFFSVREYREGDPMKRIDWKRHARTGELATIDFRKERAAQVVLLFDARDSAYVSPSPGKQHALDRNVEAASEVFGALEERGDLVGLAAFDTVPCWLGPSAGDGHAERARQLFASHPALSSIPPQFAETEGHYVDPMTHVRRQLSPEAQLMLFSPLCDDYTAEVARHLDSAGHPVTIISPNPTADRTVGQRLAHVERSMRIAALRERGIRIVDWGYDDILGLQLERAQRRWAL